MDSEFQILLDYVRTKRQLVQEKKEEEDKEVEKAEVHCHAQIVLHDDYELLLLLSQPLCLLHDVR